MLYLTRRKNFGGHINGYITFMKERRQVHLREDPHLSVPTIGKIVGREWRALSEDQRSSWKARSEIATKELQEKVRSGQATLSLRRDRVLPAGRPDRRGRTTAFFEFMKRKRLAVMKRYPKLRCAAYARILSRMYHALDIREQKKYHRIASNHNNRVNRRSRRLALANDSMSSQDV
ncbi:hypothetical protein XU18_1034 [Perkinsela sp. CCAP 1560/4]|nr:hypothetical protein XU18_1034 [Perkinsela sp. CCAP 1560/4]|eukprot:KNH08465.1 hypothetical protein XU18_1034 [Perkinsela sp. CCAP 1560/4]